MRLSAFLEAFVPDIHALDLSRDIGVVGEASSELVSKLCECDVHSRRYCARDRIGCADMAFGHVLLHHREEMKREAVSAPFGVGCEIGHLDIFRWFIHFRGGECENLLVPLDAEIGDVGFHGFPEIPRVIDREGVGIEDGPVQLTHGFGVTGFADAYACVLGQRFLFFLEGFSLFSFGEPAYVSEFFRIGWGFPFGVPELPEEDGVFFPGIESGD